MKKIFLGLAIITALFGSSISMSFAYADEPVGTYAVLNSANEVTNIIVCSASVCGGGTFGGNTVVLQTPNNPNGSQSGYLSGPGQAPVTYSPQNQTFTVPGVSNNSQSISVSDNTGTITDILGASVPVVRTFQAPTSITSQTPTLSEPQVVLGSNATFSVTEINSQNCIVLDGAVTTTCETTFQTQSLNFKTPQTITEILQTAITNKLNLIEKQIDALSKLVSNGAVIK